MGSARPRNLPKRLRAGAARTGRVAREARRADPARGAKLVTAMWEQEAAFLREAGLLPSKGCPEAGTIAVRADRDQRTRVTGEAVLEGLAPGCGFKPIVNETDHPDPLFHPLEAGYCALDPSVVRKEIPSARLGA